MQNTAHNYVASAADSVKNALAVIDIKKWSESIGGSSAEAIEAAIYCLLSMGAGFVFKKYFKLIFTCAIITLVMIKALEYAAFVSIDWNGIKIFFGITETTSVNTIFAFVFDWIKAHILVSVASGIGFLVGYKLG